MKIFVRLLEHVLVVFSSFLLATTTMAGTTRARAFFALLKQKYWYFIRGPERKFLREIVNDGCFVQ